MNIEDSNKEMKIEEVDNNDKDLSESINEQFRRSEEELKYKKHNTTEKKMYIFKNFINFLEIYGQENLGCGYEVNWTRVHRMIVDNNIFDFNNELEEVIYNNNERYDSEEFRDRCYKYIEEQILKGDPVWHLFKLSKHLTKVLQDEEDRQTMEMFKKKYDKHLCYKCKYFKNNIIVYDQFDRIRLNDYIERHPNVNPIHLNLSHEMVCKYREERVKYISDHKKEFNIGWHDIERGINRQLTKEGFSSKLLFEKETPYSYKHEFTLKPLLNQCKCKFFEENKDMTFDKYILA